MVTEDALRLMSAAYLAGKSGSVPLASPLFADLRGLPPLLLQVGSAEILLDDSLRFAARARAAGVDATLEVWEDMIHVWHAFAGLLPEGQQAIERIAAWLGPRLEAQGEPEALAAIEAIRQLKARYFRLMDTKQWDALRAVFARDAKLVDEESDTKWRGRDQIVDGLTKWLGRARTVHHGHMPEITLVGAGEARGTWSMNDWVDTPAFTLEGWGHYHERYTIEDGAWRIAELRLSRLRVVREAKPKAKASKKPRRAAARKGKRKK